MHSQREKRDKRRRKHMLKCLYMSAKKEEEIYLCTQGRRWVPVDAYENVTTSVDI